MTFGKLKREIEKLNKIIKLLIDLKSKLPIVF